MQAMAEPNGRHHALLLLTLLFFLASTARSSSSGAEEKMWKGLKAPNTNNFVRSRCKTTLYPRLCYTSLANSSATDPVRLATDATDITLALVADVSDHVVSILSSPATRVRLHNRTASALKDCVEELGDAKDLVKNSAAELVALSHATGASVALHMGNAQTWLSAALTNEDTCVDGLSTTSPDDAGGEGTVEGDVVPMVDRLKQFTSNSLALVSGLVHR